MRHFILACALAFTVGGWGGVAAADYELSEAGGLLKEAVDKVRSTVTQHKGKVSAEELDQKLREVIFPVFDFDEMAKRSLGPQWRDASPQERKEYVALFSELLSHTYLGKIRNVDNSEVSYVGDSSEGERALVRTIVTTGGDDFPINYRMKREGGTWRIYDVVIENVSLVSNYRNEFAGIVRKEGMSGLLERLREKKLSIKPLA